MPHFDIQGIEFDVPPDKAFVYIADPARLPAWTNAFASVNGTRAVLRTPDGEIAIELDVHASPSEGTVDWRMTFPDGSVSTAYSRVVPAGRDGCIFGFTLTAPPVPLEQIEGTLETQSRILTEELRRLKSILEQSE